MDRADQFAAAALTGLMAARDAKWPAEMTEIERKQWASIAWDMAAAMLDVRFERRKESGRYER
jgi:hypothetical protein